MRQKHKDKKHNNFKLEFEIQQPKLFNNVLWYARKTPTFYSEFI